MIDKFKSLIFTKICLVAVFLSVSSFQGYGQGVVSRKGKTTVTSKSKVSRTNKSNVSSPDGYINGHGYVDLGLSVKWATCNIGASSLSLYGDYFAWGETEAKKNYGWETYRCTASECGCMKDEIYAKGLWNSGIQGTMYDVAYVKWGKSWRLPTNEEIQELIDKCNWKWCFINGVVGYKISRNGRSIFMPAAGYYNGTKWVNGKKDIYKGKDGVWEGDYLSANAEKGSVYNNTLRFTDWYKCVSSWLCCGGYTVRPVTE